MKVPPVDDLRGHPPLPGVAACTIISRNYLSHAKILAKSYLKHTPGGRFYVLLVDDLAGDIHPGVDVKVLRAADLDIPHYYEMCFKYNVTELSTSVKPSFLRHLMEREGEEIALYFDPDIMIMNPLDTLLDSLSESSIALTPHLLRPIPMDGRRPSEQDILIAGAYNLGFIALRRSREVDELLRWWEERLRDGCRIDPSRGMMTDQRWVDLVPGFFPTTTVLRDDAYNVAYWNLHERTIERRGGQFLVNGRPLVFFHFSGFDPTRRSILSKHQDRAELVPGTALDLLFRNYADMHVLNGYATYHRLGYGNSAFDNGVAVHPLLRQLFLGLEPASRAQFGNPFHVNGDSSFYDWATRPRPEDGCLSRFAASIYRLRYDVAAAFPDVRGRDRDAFLSWARGQGAIEMGYDPMLVRDASPAIAPAVATGPVVETPPAAAYECDPPDSWGAGATRSYPVTVTNLGPGAWGASGPDPVQLAVTFEPADAGLPRGRSAGQFFDLAADLAPGGSQTLAVTIGAPEAPGRYRILHRMVRGKSLWSGQSRDVEVAVEGLGPPSLARESGVNVVGYLRNESGLGSAARGYIGALRTLGVPLSLKDLSALSNNRSEDRSLSRFDVVHPYDVNLYCINADQHFVVMSHLGEGFFRGRYNIGIWAWELPSFPEKWYDRFPHYDEIWAGTSFVANALAPVAPIPVVRIPPVLTIREQGVGKRARDRLGISPDEFVFLFVFDFHSYAERKNPFAAIEAFRNAFAATEPARLVIKCVNQEFDPGAFARLEDRAAGWPIDLLTGYMPACEVRDLMSACDAYVSLHRSEGTGLTISEAMAIGKPVIATGWSGNMDFMNVANSYPVRYELITLERSFGPYQKGETWADPSVEHASELMRQVYEHREEADAIGCAGRREIEANFSDEAIARLIEPRLAVIAGRHRFATLRKDLEAGRVAPKHVAYRDLVVRVRDVVCATLPADATVVVINKGDPELLDLGGRRGWHFPQTGDGDYAGYYPADGATAIGHLEALRSKGGNYLLIPATASWWLEHYAEFRRHLDTFYQLVLADETCTLYNLAVSERSEVQAGRLDRIYLQLDSIAGEVQRLRLVTTAVESLSARFEESIRGAESTSGARQEAVQRWCEESERSAGESRSRIDGLAERLNACEALTEGFGRGLEDRIEEIGQGLEARIEGLRREVEQRRGLEARIEEIGRGLEARIEGLRGEVEQRRGLEDRFEEIGRGLEARIEGLRGEVERRRGLEAQLQETCRGLEARLAGLKQGVDSRLEERNQRLDARVEGLSRDSKARSEELGRRVEARIAELSRILEIRRGELEAALGTRMAKIEETSKGSRFRIDRLVGLIDDLAAQGVQAAQVAEARWGELTGHSQAECARIEDLTRAGSERIEDLACQVEWIKGRFSARPYIARDLFGVTGDLDKPMGYALDAASIEDPPGRPVRFEDLFRGPEDFIAERQRAYLAFLRGLTNVVDLGCGRGEFLRVLAESGVRGLGVDLNPALAQYCRECGHDVVEADALEYLRQLPSGTLDAIFSAQFIQHLDPGRLTELIALARDRLRRGGVLIAETVNPESFEALKVFHVDLAHQRPIYPQVLLYKCREAGFPTARIFYPTAGGFTQRHYETAGEYAVIALA